MASSCKHLQIFAWGLSLDHTKATQSALELSLLSPNPLAALYKDWQKLIDKYLNFLSSQAEQFGNMSTLSPRIPTSIEPLLPIAVTYYVKQP